MLSELAALPNVHLAASFDHVGTPLLWDMQVSSLLWLWLAGWPGWVVVAAPLASCMRFARLLVEQAAQAPLRWLGVS